MDMGSHPDVIKLYKLDQNSWNTTYSSSSRISEDAGLTEDVSEM